MTYSGKKGKLVTAVKSLLAKACVDKHSSLLHKGTWNIFKSLRMLNAMTFKEMTPGLNINGLNGHN
jgi:hypothetical protein